MLGDVERGVALAGVVVAAAAQLAASDGPFSGYNTMVGLLLLMLLSAFVRSPASGALGVLIAGAWSYAALLALAYPIEEFLWTGHSFGDHAWAFVTIWFGMTWLAFAFQLGLRRRR